jgi:hypothetical protein
MGALLIVAGATAASYAVAWALYAPAAVPILNAAPAWVIMARALARGLVRRAVALMLVWAVTMGVAATALSATGLSRGASGDLFLRSWYRDQMIAWVRTGEGPESNPGVFLPQHAASTAVFAVTALATGGLVAMPLGAVLVNQMGEYVGALAATSARPGLAIVLGWHPWALLRVAGFVIGGTLLSAVALSRVGRAPVPLAAVRPWLAAAVALIVADVLLKWWLAPFWAGLLLTVAGW